MCKFNKTETIIIFVLTKSHVKLHGTYPSRTHVPQNVLRGNHHRLIKHLSPKNTINIIINSFIWIKTNQQFGGGYRVLVGTSRMWIVLKVMMYKAAQKYNKFAYLDFGVRTFGIKRNM